MRNFFEASAEVVYDPPRPGMKRRTEWWCVAAMRPDVARYFRWWVDKEILNPLGLDGKGLLPPAWGAHVSVVRGERPPPSTRHLWRRHQGKKVLLRCSLDARPGDNLDSEGKPFWFVEVECPELMAIRDELALATRFPLHLTVGRGP